MLNKTFLTLLICFSFLSSCALLQMKNAEKVNQLVNEKYYDEAITVYEQLSQEEKNKVDIKQLKKERSNYEKQLLKSIHQHLQKDEYVAAIEKHSEAIEKLPNSTTLIETGKEIHKKKQLFIDKYQYQYNLVRAKFLADEREILDKFMLAKRDEPGFMDLYEQHQKEGRILSEKLGTAGLDKFAKKQTSSAAQLLGLAQELKPDPRWESVLNQLEKQQARKAREQKRKQEEERKAREAAFNAKVESIKSEFEASMLSGNLPGAQKALADIKKLDLDDKSWVISAKTRLDRTIQVSLDIALKQGQLLYSRGEISKALEVWRAAQRYAPNDKALNDSIKRAATFQKNLLNLTSPIE